MRPNIVYLLAVVVTIIVVTQAAPRRHRGSWIYNYYHPPNITHHMTVGNRVRGDRLAMKLTTGKEFLPLGTLETETTLSIGKYDRITMIKALDQNTDGYGGFVTLVSGGLGYNTVTLHFRRQKGHSIKFVVEVYALINVKDN